MGKIIEVPQEREFDCESCVFNKKEAYSKKFGQRYGCVAANEEPYRSCMARKVKFVDEETYRQQVSNGDKEVKQTDLFGFN